MANTIKIKRSNDATSAPNLAQGELAYNEKSDTQTLYYGNMSDSTIVVGGKKFMDMLDHSVGTLTASSAMLVDGNSKINSIKSGTMTITGTSETFDFGAAGDITIADNLGAALEIKEGSNEYMTFTTTDNGEQVKVFKSFKLNSGVGVDRILDENNMATDSDTALATQQSIKAYVDAEAGSQTIAGLTDTAVASLGAAHVLIYDGSNSWDNKAVSGDATIATTGALTIANNAITTVKITDANVTLAKIASQAANTVIVRDANSSGVLSAKAVADTQILIGDGTGFTAAALSSDVTMTNGGAVTIANNAVTTAKINADAVTGAKIADDAIDSEHYTNASIDTAHIADDQITNALMANNAIDSAEIVAAAVDFAHIQNVAANSVLGRNANSSGVLSEIALANTQILIGDGTGFTPAALSGDVTMANTGAVTIANNAITNAKMADDSVDSDEIAAGAIDTAHIANSQVTNAKLANASLTYGSTTVALGASSTVIAGLTQVDIDNIRILDNSVTTTNSNGNLVLDPNGTGTVDVSSARITSVADPTGAQDAATKAYVDASKQGLDVKDSCVLGTAAALPACTYANGSSGVGATLTGDANGALTVDGVVVVAANRILVKNQSSAAHNGIYTVTPVGAGGAPFVLTRATDSDTATKLTSGAFAFVEKGTANADNGYVMTQDAAITMGTTTLTWVQFSGAGQISAGTGMTKTGNTLNVIGGSGITANANDISIATNYAGGNSIANLGTVTSGTWNATTLAVAYGGTGFTSATAGDMLYATGATTLGKLAKSTAGKVLMMNAGATAPEWGDVDGGTY